MSDDGGPAFPRPIGGNGLAHHEEHEWNEAYRGMSLRDYFAGQALQGLIASNDDGAGDRMTDLPAYAYDIADAMLVAREKQ